MINSLGGEQDNVVFMGRRSFRMEIAGGAQQQRAGDPDARLRGSNGEDLRRRSGSHGMGDGSGGVAAGKAEIERHVGRRPLCHDVRVGDRADVDAHRPGRASPGARSRAPPRRRRTPHRWRRRRRRRPSSSKRCRSRHPRTPRSWRGSRSRRRDGRSPSRRAPSFARARFAPRAPRRARTPRRRSSTIPSPIRLRPPSRRPSPRPRPGSIRSPSSPLRVRACDIRVALLGETKLDVAPWPRFDAGLGAPGGVWILLDCGP